MRIQFLPPPHLGHYSTDPFWGQTVQQTDSSVHPRGSPYLSPRTYSRASPAGDSDFIFWSWSRDTIPTKMSWRGMDQSKQRQVGRQQRTHREARIEMCSFQTFYPIQPPHHYVKLEGSYFSMPGYCVKRKGYVLNLLTIDHFVKVYSYAKASRDSSFMRLFHA